MQKLVTYADANVWSLCFGCSSLSQSDWCWITWVRSSRTNTMWPDLVSNRSDDESHISSAPDLINCHRNRGWQNRSVARTMRQSLCHSQYHTWCTLNELSSQRVLFSSHRRYSWHTSSHFRRLFAAPDYNRDSWLQDKGSLGLVFPSVRNHSYVLFHWKIQLGTCEAVNYVKAQFKVK